MEEEDKQPEISEIGELDERLEETQTPEGSRADSKSKAGEVAASGQESEASQ